MLSLNAARVAPVEVSLQRTPLVNARLLEAYQKERATDWFLGLNNLTAAIAGAVGGQEGSKALKDHFETLRSSISDEQATTRSAGYTEVSPEEFMRLL